MFKLLFLNETISSFKTLNEVNYLLFKKEKKKSSKYHLHEISDQQIF